MALSNAAPMSPGADSTHGGGVLVVRRFHGALPAFGRVGYGFLSQVGELLGLSSKVFELLSYLDSRDFKEDGWRFDLRELASEIKGGV